MEHTGMNMVAVKKQNRSSIIKFINQNGPVSRKDIASSMGLTPAAVTQITTLLLAEGILKELGASDEKSRVGRKKILIDIDYDYCYVISINIETELTTIAFTNLRGEAVVVSDVTTNTSLEPEAFLEEVANTVKEMLAGLKKSVVSRIKGISVGIPGIVDKQRGCSVKAYGIWDKEVNLCQRLTSLLGYECVIENNVNAFTLATLYFGEGRKYDNLHIIKWGPGVGSSLLFGGKIYEGHHGKAAELGHCIVEKDGRLCNCGRYGCLETKVSFAAMNNIVRFERDEFESAYCQGTETVRNQLEEAIDLFARTIVNAHTFIASNRIVLSGFMFKGRVIREKLYEACHYYDNNIGEEQILYSSIADREAYIGPVASFIDRKLF